MDNQNGNSPSQPTTIDSEGNEEPIDLHALGHLPNYLINPSKKDDDADDFMCDVSEDDRENGDGYDSDENAEEVNDFDDEMHMAELFKALAVTEQESNVDIEVSDRNMLELVKSMPNYLPKNIKIHNVPDDWTDPAPATEKMEPPFDLVDNPGNWSSYAFRPVFKKENGTSVYKHHCLPTGCIPVEENDDGKRMYDEWEFFYDGWKSKDLSVDDVEDPLYDAEETKNADDESDASAKFEMANEEEVTDDVSTDPVEKDTIENETIEDKSTETVEKNEKNETTKAHDTNEVKKYSHLERISSNCDELMPESRLGNLDAKVLKKLGLTSNRMKTNDFLFFYQLILPICDTARSGIPNDKRLPYYAKVEEWSNLYAFQIGLGGSYGHEFRNVTLKEIVQHDACIIRDGVRGGSSGAIYRRWQIGADYDDDIAMAISFRRWLQVKRVKKLCNNDVVPKRNEPEYDPTYKYDYIYKCIVHNVNYLSEHAELDATLDETTFATASPGEKGANVTFRVIGKPNVSKGGQTVLVCDSHRVRPRAYYHRHKLHPKPDGWTASGMIEARRLYEKLAPMVEGSGSKCKKIYKYKPHITMDNYFSGEKISEWIGKNGFGATMTCRRDRLPPGVPGKYWHKQKTDTSKKTKVARFFQPVVAVKEVSATEEHEGYRRVHVSFQSTSSCNISTVNALSKCELSVTKKERGVGANKRTWGIEMNSARELYLSTYSRIDSIDHLIKNCRLKYRSWKYWHSPMLHATALAIVIAYDMYLEVAEGKLNSDWKVTFPVDFWTFRDVLSLQMLQYNPKDRTYPGDDSMRVCTKQNKSQRKGKKKSRQELEDDDTDISETASKKGRGRPSVASKQKQKEAQEFKRAKYGRGDNSRLCGNLSRLDKHIKSVETSLKHPKACKVCGGDAYSVCNVCGVPLHFIPTKGKHAGKMCFFDYHDDAFFGLARDDTKLSNAKKSDWAYPSMSKRKENAKKWKEVEDNKNSK